MRALLGLSFLVILAAACGNGSSGSASPADAAAGDGAGSSSGGGSSGGGSGSGSSSGGGSGSSSGGGVDGGCTPPYGSGLFSAPNAWTRNVSCDPVDPSSASMTAALVAAGGWGPGPDKFQIDTSLVVLHATSTTPMVPFTRAKGYATPDCDVFSMLPLPAGGAIEGQTGYTCNTAAGDCHLLIDYPPTHTLYELYQATSMGSGIVAGCGVLWDLTRTYPDNLRGDQCTSADAAGFPMSAMLPDADEVASGVVSHAIRFALPNASIRAGVYVHPATHAGGPTGGAALPPYGVRMRLRASYPVSSLPKGAAQVLAVALQTYGMFLSDGGNIPLMVQSDQFTTHKWSSLGFDTHMLFGITPADFEVVDLSPTVKLTYNCVRNP